MKFMLIVHHDEEAFQKIEKEKRQQMLAESIELTHQLHAAGQYLSASPLHPAATAVIIRVREGKPLVTDGPFIEHRNARADRRLLPDQYAGSQRSDQHRHQGTWGTNRNGWGEAAG